MVTSHENQLMPFISIDFLGGLETGAFFLSERISFLVCKYVSKQSITNHSIIYTDLLLQHIFIYLPISAAFRHKTVSQPLI